MKTKLTASVFRMPILLLIIVAAIIALTTCTSATQFASNPAEAPNPNIKFLVPGENCSGLGTTGNNWFPVSVNVSNFKLVDELDGPNVTGEGHIHYFLDVDPPTDPGKAAITADGTYADTSDTFYYWYNIGEGLHTFSAELVNNDHTPLNPPAIAEATITAGLFWDG